MDFSWAPAPDEALTSADKYNPAAEKTEILSFVSAYCRAGGARRCPEEHRFPPARPHHDSYTSPPVSAGSFTFATKVMVLVYLPADGGSAGMK